MRQYLHLVWILGCVAGCSGSSKESDGGDTQPSDQPTAGTGSPTATAGSATIGGASAAGGASAGGAATAGASTAGSSTTSGGGSPGGKSGAGAAGSASGSAGAATAGAGGGSGTKTLPSFKFPTSVGPDQKLTKTMTVTDFDGKMTRYLGSGALGDGGQSEGQDPLIDVKPGGSVKNVILGAPAADGIHCEGSCTIDNVWWEDVGEDAITLRGSDSSNVYRISNSGARLASDKVIQHNGAGTVYVKNFLVEDFGKLYRSCGNCSTQYERHSEFDTIVANGQKGVIAGINQNYKDSANLTNIFATSSTKICERFTGNDTGAEPPSIGTGADGTYCIYATTDVTFH